MAERQQDLKSLLSVIGLGILLGVGAVAFSLYEFGPSGHYQAEQVLLDPENLVTIRYEDISPRTNQMEVFIFDQILWDKKPIDPIHYGRFFDQIKNDTSLLPVPEDVRDQFSGGVPSTIEFMMKSETTAKELKSKEPFQQLQFSTDGNHYRVEIRDDAKQSQWAYFSHPKVDQLASQLLLQK